MEDSIQWVCVHTANSLPEAYLLRSLLESKGIQVTIWESPISQHHDYLHDPHEQIRIFIPATDFTMGQHYTETFLQTQKNVSQTPYEYTP